MDPFVNSPLACHKGRIFNLPFNMNTFNQLWGVCKPEHALEVIEEQRAEYEEVEAVNLEQRALQIVGKDIFNMFHKGLYRKTMGQPASELPPQIIEKGPLRFTYDNNYYDHRSRVSLRVVTTDLSKNSYKGVPSDKERRLPERQEKMEPTLAERILFTGPIDAFFDHCLGELDYRSLRFEDERMEKTSPGELYSKLYGKGDPFTRIIEHKAL